MALVVEISSNGNENSDWTRVITVEDRIKIREKIKAGYRKNIASDDIDELLEIVSCIDEDLLMNSCSSRLEYYKQACQYDKRVSKKMEQLELQILDSIAERAIVENSGGDSVIKQEPTEESDEAEHVDFVQIESDKRKRIRREPTE